MLEDVRLQDARISIDHVPITIGIGEIGWTPGMVEVSGKYIRHHPAENVGEAEVATLEAVGKRFVIKSQQVQNRGLQIVNVNLVFGD